MTIIAGPAEGLSHIRFRVTISGSTKTVPTHRCGGHNRVHVVRLSLWQRRPDLKLAACSSFKTEDLMKCRVRRDLSLCRRTKPQANLNQKYNCVCKLQRASSGMGTPHRHRAHTDLRTELRSTHEAPSSPYKVLVQIKDNAIQLWPVNHVRTSSHGLTRCRHTTPIALCQPTVTPCTAVKTPHNSLHTR